MVEIHDIIVDIRHVDDLFTKERAVAKACTKAVRSRAPDKSSPP
jgi:hypothetical protein